MLEAKANGLDSLTDEQERRLAEVYRLLLSLKRTNTTADGDEFADQAPTAVGGAPTNGGERNAIV